MSDTLNIVFQKNAPGNYALTYSVGGVAPNLTTYTAAFRVWRSGAPTTSSPAVTATTASGVTLGTAGSITLNLVTIEAAMTAVDASEAIWMYDLSVTPSAGPTQQVCAGYLVRAQP